MDTALFINGIYDSVLSEILLAQKVSSDKHTFLQPYKGQTIAMLKKQQPTDESPIKLYISTTENLSQICYLAEIIGWENKQELTVQRRQDIDKHLE